MFAAVDQFTDCTHGKRERTLVAALSGGESLMVLANGSEMAFASGHQPTIDLVRTSLFESLCDSTGPLPPRLLEAAEFLEEAMHHRFPSSEEFGEDQYCATYVAVVLAGNRMCSGWIGSGQVKVFRGNRCVRATTPHALVVPGSNFVVATRSLSTVPGVELRSAQIDGPWGLEVGDTIVVADHRLLAQISDDDVASIVSGVSAARRLVEFVAPHQRSFASAAIVARFGQPMSDRTAPLPSKPTAVP